MTRRSSQSRGGSSCVLGIAGYASLLVWRLSSQRRPWFNLKRLTPGRSRKRWSRRRSFMDNGKQACCRNVCGPRQQGLVHGGERDNQRGFLSPARCPQYGGHAVRRHGRLDLRRPRTRRDKPCDLHAVRKGARVHRHKYRYEAIAQISDHQYLHRRPEPRFAPDSDAFRVSGWRRLPALPAREPEHGWRRGEQQSLVGRNELRAHGKRNTIPVWLAHDGRFGAQGRKSERLRWE